MKKPAPLWIRALYRIFPFVLTLIAALTKSEFARCLFWLVLIVWAINAELKAKAENE